MHRTKKWISLLLAAMIMFQMGAAPLSAAETAYAGEPIPVTSESQPEEPAQEPDNLEGEDGNGPGEELGDPEEGEENGPGEEAGDPEDGDGNDPAQEPGGPEDENGTEAGSEEGEPPVEENSNPDLPQEPECVCTDLCAEGSPNAECPVCSADPAACQGEPPAENGELPSDDQEAEDYLASLDEQTASQVEPMEATPRLMQAAAPVSLAEADDVKASQFGENYRIRVTWENERPLGDNVPKSWCENSWIAFRVPGIDQADSPQYFFTKDILTSDAGEQHVMGEFTLPYTYENIAEPFPTQFGIQSDVSLFWGRIYGTMRLWAWNYVEQEWREYYAITVKPESAVLGDILAEEGWLNVEQPVQNVGYIDDGELQVDLLGEAVEKTFPIALADRFGVALTNESQGWKIDWKAVSGINPETTFDSKYGISAEGNMESVTMHFGADAQHIRTDEAVEGIWAAFTLSCGENAPWIHYIGLHVTYHMGGVFYMDAKKVAYEQQLAMGDTHTVLSRQEIEAKMGAPIEAPDGYTFDGTYTMMTSEDDPGKTVKPGDTITIAGGHTLYMNWTPTTYTLTLDATKGPNGETLDNEKQEIQVTYGQKYGEKVPVPAHAPEHYRFNGYVIDWTNQDGTIQKVHLFDAEGNPYNIYPIAGDATAYADWVPADVTYTLDPNGGWAIISWFTFKNPDPGCTIQSVDPNFELPNAENDGVQRQGYKFLGWFTEKEGGEQFTEKTELPLVDTTYYAHWKLLPTKITFNANGGTFKDGKTTLEKEYPAASASELQAAIDADDATGNFAPTREGYDFLGWALSAASTQPDKYFTWRPGDEVTFYAVWDKSAVTIYLDPGEGTLPAGAAGYVRGKPGAAVNIPKDEQPTRTGYTLTGWAAPDGTTNTTPGSYTIPENAASHTIRAQWKANSYTIAFSPNYSGEAAGSMTEIAATYDQSVTLPANTFTQAGYTFTGWNTQANGKGTAYADGAAVRNLTAAANGTVTLYAQWEAGPVTVSFHPNGGQLPSDAASSKTVTYQETYGDLPEPTRDRYTFTGWNTSADGSGTEVTGNSKVENPENHTLYAQWDYNYFTLEFDLRGGVGSAFAAREQERGKEFSLPAAEPTRTGWEFEGWSTVAGGNVEYEAGGALTYNGTAPLTLYAVWSSTSPTVTYEPNAGNDQVTNLPDDQLLENGQATLSDKTPTREGYTFQGWGLAEDGAAVYQPGDTVYSADSITLYAIWQTQSVAGEVVTITLVDPRGSSDGNGGYTQTTQTLVLQRGSQFTLPEIEAVEFLGWKNSTSTTNSAQYAGGEGLVAEKDASYTAVYANEDMYWKWRANPTDPWGASSTLTRATDSINEKSGSEKLIVLLKTKDYYTKSHNETITAGNYTIDLNGLGPGVKLKVNAGNSPVTDMVIQNGGMAHYFDSDDVCTVITVEDGCGKLTLKNLTVGGAGLPGITVHGGNTVTLDDVEMEGLIADGDAQITVEYAEIGNPPPPYYNTSSASSQDVLIYLKDTSTLTIRDGYFWRATDTTDRYLIHAASNAMLNIQGGYFAQTNNDNSSWGNWSESGEDTNKFYQTGTSKDNPCAIWNEGGSDLAFSKADPQPDWPKGVSSDPVWYAVSGSASEAYYWEINGSEVKDKYPNWEDYTTNQESVHYKLLRGIGMQNSDTLSIGGEGPHTTVDLDGRNIEPNSNSEGARTVTLTNATLGGGSIKLPCYYENNSISLQKGVTIEGNVLLAAHTITLDDSVVFEPGARLACRVGPLDTTKRYGDTVLRLVGTSNSNVGWNVPNGKYYYIAVLPGESDNDAVSINYHSNYPSDSGMTAQDSTTSQTPGQTMTLPSVTAPTGFTLLGWNTASDGAGTAVTEKTKYSASLGTDFYAIWQRNTVTVTFDPNGGQLVDSNAMTVKRAYGTPLGSLPEATLQGYTLDGWYTAQTGGTLVTSETAVKPTDKMEVTYYAHWTEADGIPYTVKYMCDGTLLDEQTFYGKTGKNVQVSELVATFTGYTYTGHSLGEGKDSLTITADGSAEVILYYTKNTYKITASAVNAAGEPITEATIKVKDSYTVDEQVTLTAPPVEGYTFTGWAGDFTGTASTLTFQMPDRDVEVEAQYEKTTYSVGLNLTNLTAPSGNITATHGENYTRVLQAMEGYTLPDAVTVTMGGTKLTAGTGYTYTNGTVTVLDVTGPITITAAGEPKVYTVTRTGDNNLTLSGGDNATHGSSYTAAMTVAAGYAFPDTVTVTMDGKTLAAGTGYQYDTFSGTVYLPKVTGDVKIEAKAKAAHSAYAVEHYLENLDGGYPDTPEKITYGSETTGQTVEGSDISVDFEGFTLDETESSAAFGTPIAGDGSTVLKLYYTRNSYEVTLADGFSWDSSDAKTVWKYQETVDLTLASRTGYTAAWTAKQEGKTVASGMSEAVSFQMPAGDVTVTLAYSPVEVTVSRAKLDRVDFEGDPEAYYEQAFTAKLVADTGYSLPEAISITTGDKKLEAGQDFTYNPDTGEVTILEKVITGTVEITAVGVPATFKAEVQFKDNEPDGVPILSASPAGAEDLAGGGSFTTRLTANVLGWELPQSVTVTMDGNPLTQGVGYTYSPSSGLVRVTNITGDVVITASPALDDGIAYQVQHYQEELNGGYKLVETENLTGVSGDTATAVPKTYEGYDYDSTQSTASGNIKADGSLVLSLYYKRAECMLTVITEKDITAKANGTPESEGTYRYHYGDMVEVEVTSVEQGTSFLGWFEGGAQRTDGKQTSAKRYSFIITKDTTLVAKSGVGTYELVVNGSNGTHNFKEGAGYETGIKFNDTRTFAITPGTGHHLPETVRYVVDGMETLDGLAYNNQTGAVTLTIKGDASFEFAMVPNTYTLILDPCGGRLAQNTLTVTYAAAYGELPRPSRSGYRFEGWYTAQQGGERIDAEMIYTIDGPQTLYAQWERIRSSGGGGDSGRPLLPPSDPQTETEPPVITEPAAPVDQGTPVSSGTGIVHTAEPEAVQPSDPTEPDRPSDPPAEEVIAPELPTTAQEVGKPFVLLNAVAALLAVLLAALGRSKGKRRGIALGCAVGAAAITLLTIGWDGITVADLWTIPVAALTLIAGYFSRRPQASQEAPQDPA